MNLPFYHRADVMRLARERVPLGVIARGLNLPRHVIKAAAVEMVAEGWLAELPPDDIRGGKTLTWADDLPGVPEEEAEAADASACEAMAEKERQREAAAQDAEAPAAPTTWPGLTLKPQERLVADILSEHRRAMPIDRLVEEVRTRGYACNVDSIRVVISCLRKAGLSVKCTPGVGYTMDAEARAKREAA